NLGSIELDVEVGVRPAWAAPTRVLDFRLDPIHCATGRAQVVGQPLAERRGALEDRRESCPGLPVARRGNQVHTDTIEGKHAASATDVLNLRFRAIQHRVQDFNGGDAGPADELFHRSVNRAANPLFELPRLAGNVHESAPPIRYRANPSAAAASMISPAAGAAPAPP